MIHSDSYLYCSRHGIYYFRVLVPKDMREEIQKFEYRCSLRTRDVRVARTMARALRVCFEAQLQGIRLSMITWEQLRKALDETLERLLAQEREKLRREGPYPPIADGIWKHDTIPNFQRAIEDISTLRSNQTNVPTEAIPEFAANLADGILRTRKIDLDKANDLFALFCEATVRMWLEFTQQRIVLNDEARHFKIPQTWSPSASPHSLQVEPPGTPISEVADKYRKEMMAGGNWTAKTESEYRAAHQLLINVVNDMPIAIVDHPTAQYFKEILVKLPSNMNKKPLYRDKPVKEVAKMQIPKDDLLSISKVNAYIGRVSELFKWAIKNGHTQLNPFTGIKLKQKVADHEKRIPFDDANLKALFSTPIFQKGEHKHPYFYWLPLLGLFTGARIDELCQLYLEDIYQVADLWVIDINDALDKKLKNQPSKRVIPIHSRLIKLGLVEFVDKLRKKGEVRLFPELKKGRDGYSQAASKWFTRYRIRCGVTDDRKAFHSFRHTVDNFMKQRKEVREIMGAVLGHKDESMTTGWYGLPYEAHTLVSAIESLDFPIEVISYE